MAIPKLFKIKRKRYYDADGKRCSKSTPGAVCRIEQSDDWYADIKPTETTRDKIERRRLGLKPPKRKRVKLCVDKYAAQQKLIEFVKAENQQSAGIKSYQAIASQPLSPMVEDFQKHLKASGRTQDYIETTIARIEKVLSGCQILRLRDIDCLDVEQWLLELQTYDLKSDKKKVRGTAKSYQEIADAFEVSVNTVTSWRQRGAPIIPKAKNKLADIAKWHQQQTKPKNIGTTTRDHYVTALKRFGNWLVRPARKCEANPFGDLSKLHDKTEIRKQRRVLDAQQFGQLIAAAKLSNKVFRGLTGEDRANIYLLAAYTGLRASEIASLRTNSLDFIENTVTVEAAYTKNKKLAVLPLRSDLASTLLSYLQSRPRETLSIDRSSPLVWDGTWNEKAAKMIRIDLEAAGIPYNQDGGDYDFHALRHQFITGLAQAGVSLRSAQELARHSRPELTANVYTHLTIRDSARDVEKLVPIPSKSGATPYVG